MANIDDWVIGTGSSTQKRQGFLVYMMRVTKALSYNEYWTYLRYRLKRPNLRSSLKYAFGDNIYFRGDDGQWKQADSHHSYVGGTPNQRNIETDTQTDRVLLSTDFAYWGGVGPKIPDRFLEGGICIRSQGHKCHFPHDLVNEFIKWFRNLDESGYQGEPINWKGEI